MKFEDCSLKQTVQVSNMDSFFYLEFGEIIQINPAVSFNQTVQVRMKNRINKTEMVFEPNELRLVSS